MATVGVLSNHAANPAVNTAEPTIESINQRIGKVYAYTAQALGLSALSAGVFAKTGFATTIAATLISSPLLGAVALTAIGVALMAATLLTPKENSLLRYGCYGMFAVFEGLVLSPLVLINATAFATATVAAVALTGGLGVLAMHLKESFERYERILMVSLGAIAVASLGALALPAAAAELAHKISYLGGFALFSGLVIYDTHKARKEAALPNFDPIKHAMSIYLDAMNLLIRLWETFAKK